MLRNPSLYGIPVESRADDKYLEKRRSDLIHTAALLLDKHNLIRYERKTGNFQVSVLFFNLQYLLLIVSYIVFVVGGNKCILENIRQVIFMLNVLLKLALTTLAFMKSHIQCCGYIKCCWSVSSVAYFHVGHWFIFRLLSWVV